MTTDQGHWNQIAKNWQLVGAPLRPTQPDLVLFQDAIMSRATKLSRPMNALIFGVTPELAGLDWPLETELYALDASASMIDTLWRGPKERAHLGSWLNAPFADSAFDVIVCDGGFGVLDFPISQSALLSEVARLLQPGGIFVLRLFTPGCQSESIDEIANDLNRGQIKTLDVLKFRLWGALQHTTGDGVAPREVVCHIEKISGGLNRLVTEHGFSADHVATLELHRHSKARYCLSGPADLALLLSAMPEMYIVGISYPEHLHGNKCPVVVIKRTE